MSQATASGMTEGTTVSSRSVERAVLKDVRSGNIFAMIFDIVSATFLVVYALIVGPLGVLRGPIAFERYFWYVWVLVPQGLMSRSMRAAIDWRFGNFDAAIAQIEGLIGSNEEYFKELPASRARRRVLEDFYTVLARAYLHAGHIDDAMLVVIRAKRSLGIDRLGGLAELDAKTAHLVRAGLAAGRLLDGGGLATMFVKSTPVKSTPAAPISAPQIGPKTSPNSPNKPENSRPLHRQGASRSPLPPKSQDSQTTQRPEAKIIPFPTPEMRT